MSLTSFTDPPSPLADLAPEAAHASVHVAADARLQGRLDGARSLVRARDDAREEEAAYHSRAVALVVVGAIVRLVCLAPVPLGNGEAYYFSWSRFLDWSYYDHPPLVAWMARLTTLWGASQVAIRVGPVLACAAFGLLFYRLAERFTRPRAAFFALVLITAIPVFLGSSFILNPEAPLAPLWIAFLLAVDRMRERDEWYRPLAAGALLGCAFLAKYTAVLLVPTTIAYVALAPSMRRWLRRPSFYSAGLLALLVTSPVLLWNEARGWPSVRLHLLERASVAVPVAGENTVNHLVEISSSSGTGLLESLLRVSVGQLLAYSPLIAPLLVAGLVAIAWRARKDERDLFLAVYGWPILLFLLATMTVIKDAEQHWTMMAFVPAVIAAGRIVDGEGRWARGARWLAGAGVALSAVVFLLANIHVRSPVFLRFMPPGHYDPRADITNELTGWDQVKAGIAQAVAAAPAPVVVASNHYSMCARAMFETHDDPPVYCPTARRSEFDFIGRRDPPASASVVLLTNDIHDEIPAGLSDRVCSLVDQIDIERGGRRVARYFVHSCAPTIAAPPAPDPGVRSASR